MTEKLYYSDSYITEFCATIVGIESVNNKTAIILDKTAFFPEGGGQPADTGYIENIFIHDVIEKNGKIYHFTDKDVTLSQGSPVFCKINADKRFMRMQAHSGEHIVSGIAHKLFGAENVGFHMDDTLMTVDFNIPFTKEQLQIIEEMNAYELKGNDEDLAALNEFQKRWKEIGFVPFKEKDNVAEAYRKAVAKFPSKPLRRNRPARVQLSEKDQLIQKYHALEQDIVTYENNIGFFSMSKNSAPLIQQMQAKIDKSKDELKALAAQIKALKEAEQE
jgi:Ser-tRNA(Ala) deacylase AlaX